MGEPVISVIVGHCVDCCYFDSISAENPWGHCLDHLKVIADFQGYPVKTDPETNKNWTCLDYKEKQF